MAPNPLTTMKEDDAIEEGFPNEAPGRDASPNLRESNKKELSVISRKYDLDGDGQLDAAEQAMRDMDKSGKGYLSNDTIYKLMQEHISTQNQLFSMKRVVIALTCFTAVLAVSNLATAWAAAVLAKDTKVQGGALADKVTGNTVGTNPMSNIYGVKEDLEQGDNGRRDLLSVQALDFTKGEVEDMAAGNTAFIRQYCSAGHVDRQLDHANVFIVTEGKGSSTIKKYEFPVHGIANGYFRAHCPKSGPGNQACTNEAFSDNVQCPVADCNENDCCPPADQIQPMGTCSVGFGGEGCFGCGKSECGGAFSNCDCANGEWMCF